MTDPTTPGTAQLRARLKQLREQQSPEDTYRGALLIRGRLFTWLATTRTRLRDAGKPEPDTIAAFWPLPHEPELQPLLKQWVQEEGYRVCLPVVTGADEPLQFRLWSPDTPMTAGAYGIQEPAGDIVPAPDVMLVPTLGYTRRGDRLGYGKGYYDRTLAALRATGHPFVAIGIAWATGDLSGRPYQPAAHDQPLDAILTDKGWAVPAPVLE
jgi:5-formyltetrahydrofolate cyclo-ligase